MIKRVFLNCDEPFLWKASNYILNHFNNFNSDPNSINTIYTPTKRSARRLTELLCSISEDNSLEYSSWNIKLISEIQNDILALENNTINRIDSLIIWESITKKYKDRNIIRNLSLENPIFYLESLRKQLSSIKKTPSEIVEYLRQEHKDVNTEIWQVLSDLWDEYENELKENNLKDEYSWVYNEKKYANCTNTKLFLVACQNLSLAQEELLIESHFEIETLIPSGESDQQGFNQCGSLITNYWQSKYPNIDQEDIIITDTDSNQIELCSNYILNLLSDNVPESMISLAPLDNELLGPLILKFDQLHVPTITPGIHNLQHTSIGSLTLLLLEVFKAGDKKWVEFVSHPLMLEYFKNELKLDHSNIILRDLDKIKVTTTSSSLNYPDIINKDIKARLNEIKRKLIELNLQHPKNENTLEAFILETKSILHTILKNSQMETDEISKISDLLESLKSDQSFNVQIQANLYHHIVNELIFNSDIILTSTKGVEILGWNEVQLDDAQALFILSATDSFLSQKTAADPLLPNSLKNFLGITNNEQIEAMNNLYLNNLVNSKQVCKFFVPKKCLNGDSTKISKHLILNDQDLCLSILSEFYSEEPKQSLKQSENFKIPNLIKVDKKDRIFPLESLSASKIRSYLRCPYNFYLNYILKLDLIDYNPIELGNLEVGKILHYLFDTTNKVSANNLDIDDVKSVEDFYYKTIKKHVGNDIPLPTEIQLELIKKKFKSFIEWHSARLGHGHRVLASEHKFSNKNLIRISNNESIEFNGSIDRVDYNSKDKKLTFIDFKTGDQSYTFSKAETKNGWKDPQLPLYAKFEAQNLIKLNNLSNETTIELKYVSFSKNGEVVESQKTYSNEIGEEVVNLSTNVAESIFNCSFWPPKITNELTKRLLGNSEIQIDFDEFDEEEAET